MRGGTVEGDHPHDIKDENDELIRTIIALRDRKCITCPSTEALHPGHLFRRGIEVLRWNKLNNNAQCNFCNFLHETNPQPYIDIFVQTFGIDAYNTLQTLSDSSHKHTYIELLAIRDSLRAEVERLQNAA